MFVRPSLHRNNPFTDVSTSKMSISIGSLAPSALVKRFLPGWFLADSSDSLPLFRSILT